MCRRSGHSRVHCGLVYTPLPVPAATVRARARLRRDVSGTPSRGCTGDSHLALSHHAARGPAWKDSTVDAGRPAGQGHTPPASQGIRRSLSHPLRATHSPNPWQSRATFLPPPARPGYFRISLPPLRGPGLCLSPGSECAGSESVVRVGHSVSLPRPGAAAGGGARCRRGRPKAGPPPPHQPEALRGAGPRLRRRSGGLDPDMGTDHFLDTGTDSAPAPTRHVFGITAGMSCLARIFRSSRIACLPVTVTVAAAHSVWNHFQYSCPI